GQPLTLKLLRDGQPVELTVTLGAASRPLSSGQRGLLGIQMITTDNGVRIERVTLGMPAARAGVRPGDIVTKVGTVEVPTQEKLSEVLSGFRPGETVTLALRRAGQDLEVACQPAPEGGGR